VHSNGFSLVRKIVLKDHHLNLHQKVNELGGILGEILLTQTKIYVRPVLQVLENSDIHAICHITGGGFDENIPRVLAKGQGVAIEESAWHKPNIFEFLEKLGKIPHRQMFNIFNMGIGMLLIADESQKDMILSTLKVAGEEAVVIGKVIDKEGVYIE